MPTTGVKRKEYTHVLQQLELYALFYVQAACGKAQNSKKLT